MGTTDSEFVTRACNNCNGHIEFEAQYASQRVACPHCGTETVLRVPQRPPPLQHPSPRPSDASQDYVFLYERDIIVTKTRFIAPGQTYVLANISSVSVAEIPPSVGGGIFLTFLGIGILVICVALLFMAPAENQNVAHPVGFLGSVAGVALATLGFYLTSKEKPSYVVLLSTTGGEVRTCTSKDEAFIRRIVAALNEAIVARG